LGFTPSARKISGCLSPSEPWSVWVMIGTPVAFCAARRPVAGFHSRPSPVAHDGPALMPVEPMPSSISFW
jgi:hypothetical protein